MKLQEIVSVDFDMVDQLLMKLLCVYLLLKKWEDSAPVHKLTADVFRREILSWSLFFMFMKLS